MKNLVRPLLICLAIMALPMTSTLFAQEFDNGIAALEAGNYEEAIELFEIAANDGHLNAQIYLGTIFYGEAGTGIIAQNYKKSLHFFQMAAKQGDASSQFAVGEIHANGLGKDVDYSLAAPWYKRAASQGHPGAQNQLWQMYAAGSGVPKDNVIALMWIMVATHTGNLIDEKAWDELALHMSQDQLLLAETYAKTCIHTSFETCGT